MKQSRRGLRQVIESCTFFKIEKFPAEEPHRGRWARCAPYDSRRIATRFVICPRGRPWQGKGNTAAYRRLFTPPVASLPERESRGQSRPQNPMLTRMRFSTPNPFCTAQRGGYAWGISAAGVAFVAEAMTADMRHGLIWPSGHEPFRPVQSARSGERPATSPKPHHDRKGVPALWTPDQPSADWIPLKCSSL
jgi:hypothetical protein